MTRLDHNRAIAQISKKAGVPVSEISNVTIWGNHSATQYPDLFNAKISGKNAADYVADQEWLENSFIPTVAKRGAAIIEARGSSSAASAASAALDTSSPGSMGPPRATGPRWAWCPTVPTACPRAWSPRSRSPRRTELRDRAGLELNAFSRTRIDASVKELSEERDAVRELGLI